MECARPDHPGGVVKVVAEIPGRRRDGRLVVDNRELIGLDRVLKGHREELRPHVRLDSTPYVRHDHPIGW